MQDKNTINTGDAIRDYADREVAKKAVSGLWSGARESDLTVKSEDFKISEKTAQRLFGMPISGKVRLGWRLANVFEGKNVSLATLPEPDLDYYIHIRPDGDEMIALAIPREKIVAYWRQYGREIKRKDQNTTQIQLNTPSPTLPIVGSKKWRDLMSFVSYSSVVDKIYNKAEKILEKVNEAGREESTANSCNPRQRARKVGIPYQER